MLREHMTDYLAAYCHGELGQDDSCRVAHHLRVCPECRAAYDQTRFTVLCGEHLVKTAAPEGLWNQIEAALDHPQQLAFAREPRWRAWRDFAPSWPMVAAACAALLIGVWFGVRYVNPPRARDLNVARESAPVQQAGILPVRVDLSSYLGPIQAAPRAESYDAVTSAPPKFQACEKKTLLALGLSHVLERHAAIEGFELNNTRIQNYQDRRVVQLVYSGAGEAFSVFVGPRDVEFRFGQEHSYDTVVGGIKTRKVDCPYQKSYAFAGNDRKYVIISKSLDEARALKVMQFFLTGEIMAAQ